MGRRCRDRRGDGALTASLVKCRTVRRCSPALARPAERASLVPSQKRSSFLGRTRAQAPGPSAEVTASPRPRTIATGTSRDLPLTRSAALATSSAMATTVISRVRPYASVRPVWSSRQTRPATPMALSVRPLRQARPIVSVTTTANRAPSEAVRLIRSRRAEASGSTGRSTTVPASTLLASIPAAAMTRPCRVSTMRVVFLGVTFVASARTDSASMRSSREAAATTLPSALETILLVMTRMSPSCTPVVPSGQMTAAQALPMSAARSSFALMRGSPGTAHTCRPDVAWTASVMPSWP